MADKRISELPIGNLIPETIIPVVTSGITSRVSFKNITDSIALNDIYVTGGTYFNGVTTFTNTSGVTFSVSGFVSADTFVNSVNFDSSNYMLVLNQNNGTSFSSDLSVLASDITVTGGNYNTSTGIATFTNNSGGTFNVTGFLTGMTDTFTTGATLNGNIIQFNNNIYGSDYYNVNLSPILSGKSDLSLFSSHTGNTNNPHQTSFNNLISTGHTHSISDVSNLLNSLNSKFDKSGGTISGNIITNSLSATTYQNLPLDIYVTGGSYNVGTAQFINNTGGTFSVTGFNNVPYLGSIIPTSPAYTGTSAVFWTATQAGTYTNFGNVVVSGNSFATISRTSGGTFSISQTPLNLGGYALLNEINFPTWSGISYITGQKVNYLGKYWKAITGTTSADTPSISANWIEDNSYGNIKVISNLYNKDSITTGVYVNASGALIVDATYNTSDFIEVKPSTNYNGNGSMRFKAFYDINKTAITSEYNSVGTSAFTTSVNARFVRVSLTVPISQSLDLREGISDGLVSPKPYEKTIPYNELNVDSILVNPKINLFNNTENLASGYFSIVSSTKGTDTINYKGVTLTKLTGNSFYAALESRLTTLAIPTFIVGEKYLLSYYIVNLGQNEKFIWMRPLANTLSNGHEPKLIDGNVRRVWTVVQASSTTAVRALSNPILDWNTQTAITPTWLFSGNNFSSPDTQALSVYIGGYQIEKLDSNTYVNGVALIGDSTMAGGSGGYDKPDSREVSTYVAGMLNIPVFNRAVGGERTDTMDARWATDITPLAKNCKYAIIQGGINDISQDRVLSGIQSSISSMYNKAITDGLIPILLTCTPASSIASVPAREADRIALNLWMKTTYPIVIDIAEIVADPENQSILNPIWAGDGIHYTGSAKRAIANSIVKYEFWNFKTPKPYQPILSNWTPTKQLPFVKRIGEISDIQNVDNDLSYYDRTEAVKERLVLSRQLLDKDDLVYQSIVHNSDTVSTSSILRSTNFIKVTPNKSYYFTQPTVYRHGIMRYSGNTESSKIGRLTESASLFGAYTFVMPSDTNYVKVGLVGSGEPLDTSLFTQFSLSEGDFLSSTLRTYNGYYVNSSIQDLGFGLKNGNLFPLLETEVSSYNLLDYSSRVQGMNINPTLNGLVGQAGASISQKIKCDEGKTYTFIGIFDSFDRRLMYYNDNGVVVSGLTLLESNYAMFEGDVNDNNQYISFTVPTGTSITHFRIQLHSSDPTYTDRSLNYMVYEGNIYKPFTNYVETKKIDGFGINPKQSLVEDYTKNILKRPTSFSDKTFLLIGDSISSNQIWVNYFNKSIRPKKVWNYSVGGRRIINTNGVVNPSAYQNSGCDAAHQFVANFISGTTTAPDYVMICLGTNEFDKSPNTASSTESDVDSAFTSGGTNLISLSSVDITKINGAMRYMVETLSNQFPSTKFIFWTPIPNTLTTWNSQREVADTIKWTARRMSIPVFDLQSNSNIITLFDYPASTPTYRNLVDGVHPFGTGVTETPATKMIAERMSSDFLNYIINN